MGAFDDLLPNCVKHTKAIGEIEKRLEEKIGGKKMRLIDADEFAIEEPKLWDWNTVDDISSTRVLKQCIWDVQCAPIVNAVPVEWIEAYLDKLRAKFEEMDRFIMEEYAGYEDNFYRTKVRYIEEMLKDWGKENETEPN